MTKTYTGLARVQSGIDSEPIDSMTLSMTSRIASEAAKGLISSRGKDDWIVLMQAISDLTSDHAADGDPYPLFSADSLREKCGDLDPHEKLYWTSQEDTGRKKFSKAWEKLVSSFPNLDGNLRERAAKARLPAKVELYEAQDPHDKRAKLYGLRAIALDLPALLDVSPSHEERSYPPSPPHLQAAAIEYGEEMEVYPIPGIKRPLKFNLGGWNKLFMFLPLIGALIAIAFSAWLLLAILTSDLPVRQVFKISVTLLIFAGLISVMVWPLYLLIDQGIVLAPDFLQLTIPDAHVLILRKEGDESVLRMVRYTATCPLCGGVVTIAKGRGPYRHRYVGICKRNSVEHLFSFDHVLRQGRHLF